MTRQVIKNQDSVLASGKVQVCEKSNKISQNSPELCCKGTSVKSSKDF